MELYLVRHAIAFERDSARWPDDRDRPLTPDGVKRFRLAARGLRNVVAQVEHVLSSPLARAWQTSEILEEIVGWPGPVRVDALEPDRSQAETLAALQPYAQAESMALVGHEPHLHLLASHLLTGDQTRALLEMKKGAVACLSLAGGLAAGSAWLRWLLPPKVLRSLEQAQ